MNTTFQSTLLAKHPNNAARVMQVTTPHGEFTTPVFMPVGTRAVVNYLTPHQLETAGSQIILGGNTYHMLVHPGQEVISNSGGMHRFMAWNRPMLTDSGGYQVLSLSKDSQICKINDTGARFKHPTTGKVITLDAKTSIETQKWIGADIIMAFDQCTPEVEDKRVIVKAMERTYQWLQQSKATHEAHPDSQYGHRQAFFAIIQGGYHRELREQCTEHVLAVQPDGIAIGGEVIGYDMAKTCEIMGWLDPLLPQDKLRYTMGVGLNPQNLLDVVAAGADMFDCVAPTRNARHGALYCGEFIIENNWPKFISDENRGHILIKKTRYSQDTAPVMASCDCYTCQHFGKDYLHFLFKTNTTAFINLACIHNIRVMHRACELMRDTILNPSE